MARSIITLKAEILIDSKNPTEITIKFPAMKYTAAFRAYDHKKMGETLVLLAREYGELVDAER